MNAQSARPARWPGNRVKYSRGIATRDQLDAILRAHPPLHLSEMVFNSPAANPQRAGGLSRISAPRSAQQDVNLAHGQMPAITSTTRGSSHRDIHQVQQLHASSVS
jgi:hypothetical protein